MTGITEQGNLDTETQTQGEHHVTMETDKDTKDCQPPSEAGRGSEQTAPAEPD